MTDFPTLSHSSISEMSTLSYTWGLKKVPFSKGASLWLAILGGTPSPSPPPGGGENGQNRLDALTYGYVLSIGCKCYPSYINCQMPLCCSLSLLSWHKYKIVRWGEVFIIVTQSPYARKNLGTSAGHLSQLFPLSSSEIIRSRGYAFAGSIIFCRCSNIRTDCKGEGLFLIHVPTITKAVLNITRTFKVNRTSEQLNILLVSKIVVRRDFDFVSYYSGPSQHFIQELLI